MVMVTRVAIEQKGDGKGRKSDATETKRVSAMAT